MKDFLSILLLIALGIAILIGIGWGIDFLTGVIYKAILKPRTIILSSITG